MSEPKQHHYVPQAYLRHFADVDGQVTVYDLWEARSFRTSPKNILKERDLYTQPVHAEKSFSTRMEEGFSDLEARWPPIVSRLEQRTPLSIHDHEGLVEFVAALRVRVKHTLKSIAVLLRQNAEEGANLLDPEVPADVARKFREFYPALSPSKNREGIHLSDLIAVGAIDVSVDPHRGLTNLPFVTQSLVPVFGRLRLCFLHNRTAIDFITSDNPVIYFANQGAAIEPYPEGSRGDFDFHTPLTPRLALRYSTNWHRRPTHRDEHSPKVVERLNTMTARFADRYLIARSAVSSQVAAAFPDTCPIPDLARSSVYGSGEVTRIAYKWGKPIRWSPTWDYGF